MPTPFDLAALASHGVHIDISNENYKPSDLSALMTVVVKSGGHLTVNGKGFRPFDFSALASIGKTHLTIKW